MKTCLTTPEKWAFRTEAAAQTAATRALVLQQQRLEVYPCGCEGWHLRNGDKRRAKLNRQKWFKRQAEAIWRAATESGLATADPGPLDSNT